ncbi:hypothetical protein POJ06DRAFT_245338 [Lipomyces tetrasporus]|uniref:Uncharacterized protein n=1 Tax=Lipomyces tetrasporus TaxID=54092 RepID=A0AAD7QWB5_9ASCO|nr:uncharacterized protein POJ06DRAFT_245338 [Lipomyces tetrasporus]KAJ8102679.1 hypothetical protein POJ06DRAFT_245338 [Lipomyces tetrasporus]
MDHTTAIANDTYNLYVGMVLDTDNHAREYVQQYAVQHNFAVKNGHVSNKQKTLLLVCKCANKYDPGKLPLEKSVINEHGLICLKDARTKLSECPWRVRFKKQLNDTWIVTEMRGEHKGHQLEGINPFAYPENRPLTPAAKEVMVDLARNTSASRTTIAGSLNQTFDLHLVGKDVSNRTYDYTKTDESSTAKFIQQLEANAYIYRMKLTSENALDALFFCSPEDVQAARLFGQMVVIDATYKTNRFRFRPEFP